MDLEEDELCNPSNPEKRLRLRKDCKKESTDNKSPPSNRSNDECKQDDISCASQVQYDDDSILDFKSPKKVYSVQQKVTKNNRYQIKSKKKVPCSKPKIVINEKKTENSKTSQNRKVLHDIQQPSIESSFFKTEKKEDLADIKTAFVCPLCFKNFKDESSQAVHMKSCAIKNNVSTKQLMVAVELQERQAAERKSLGLLSAPVLQEKKKSVLRKMVSHDDPDLQLALALSKSLYEEEEMKEWDETQMVVISSMPENNAQDPQKTTLHNFGFISDRNISPADNLPISKTKRKGRPTSQTILQRRTVIERERILAERIAEILMGYKDFTQRLQEKEEENHNIEEKIVIKNGLLQQLRQTENTLWDRTTLISAHEVFYVNQLLPQITPLKKKTKLNTEQDIVKHTDQSMSNGKSERGQVQEIKKIENVKSTIDKEDLMTSSNELKTCCEEESFLDIFVTSWGNILNDSSASDIIVFVKNGKHIWTHKLVFYVRCANILLDVISNDTEFSTAKEKICWIDTDYDIALAFLEFIYCGIIKRNSKILDINASLSSIRSLARKYKVNDLFAYLRQREATSNVKEPTADYNTYDKCTENIHKSMKTTSSDSELNESSSHISSNYTHDYMKNNQCSQKVLLQEDINDNINSLEDDRTFVKEAYVLRDDNIISIKSSSNETKSRNNTPTNVDFTPSPDMFEDTPDMTKYNNVAMSKEHENFNIHMLLNLIKEDTDAGICSQKSSVRRTQSTEYSTEDTCSKLEQDVIEIDSDLEANSIKHSVSDTPQSNKSNIPKQKSNLTLFIEKIQRENAKSDSDLDTDSDMECDVQISSVKRKNPFHINKDISEDFQSCNVKQPTDTEKKHGKLSIIERCIQSYANKNPEFYSRLSNEYKNDKQTDTLHTISVSPQRMMEASYDNTLHYNQNYILSIEKDSNFTEQIITTPLSAPCSLPIKTVSQSSSDESIFDVEMNEEEISMYSKYMKDHKDNSIANYRTAIKKTILNSDLSDKSTSSNSVDEINDNDEHKNDKVLTQNDADIIISSDTEVESIFSSVSCPLILRNDDSDRKNSISYLTQQYTNSRENSRQNIEYEENIRSISIAKDISAKLEEQRDINIVNGSNQDKVNSCIENKSDNVSFIQKKCRLNKLRDNQKEFVSNSITEISNQDFLNIGSQTSDNKYCNKFTPKSSDSYEPRKSYSFNFEDDIYLANVDVNKYEKQRDHNVISLTQNSTSIRKFKKKSLSEGQISMSKLYKESRNFNQETFKPLQLQHNDSQNIGDTKIAAKLFDKDVTPPPDYNGMSTPELHREMKKYGLKIQKRSRALKLLSHIYNELHPLVPANETTGQQITEISSDEDDRPPLKKRNVENNYGDSSNNIEDNDDELLYSQDSNKSTSSAREDAVRKEIQFYETESLPALEDSPDIAEAFTKLINLDTDLYNKILQYEPVNIEEIRSTLRTHGFKCKLSNLMSFLDEQCITFYVPEQRNRQRIRRKK